MGDTGTAGIDATLEFPAGEVSASTAEEGLGQPRMSRATLGLLTGIALIVSFSESMLIPALPVIQSQYGASPTDVAWVPAIYLLVGAATVPLLGKLGDIYGRKRMLIVVMGVYSAAALANGFSWSLESLIAFRAVQGIGIAMYPLAFALIHDEMPAQRVPFATGLVSGMNSVGSTVGLLGGAFITDLFGWQANYRLLGPVALALTVALAFIAVEGRRREKEGIDYAGAAFFAVGIGLLLVAVTEGGVYGWGSPQTIGLFLGAAAFLIGFILFELRVKVPLMNLRLPKIGLMLKTDGLMFVAGAAFYLGFYVVIYFSQGPEPGFSLNVTGAALILLPGCVSMIVFALLAGVLMRRYGVKLPEVIALALFVLGFVTLLAFHASPLQVAIGFIPIMAGVAMLFNCVVNATMILAPPEKVGVQNASLMVFEQVGEAIAAAIAGAALLAYTNPATGNAESGAYILLCVIGLIVAAVGFVILLSMPRIDVPKSSGA